MFDARSHARQRPSRRLDSLDRWVSTRMAYIIENLVIIAAALVLGGTVRGRPHRD